MFLGTLDPTYPTPILLFFPPLNGQMDSLAVVMDQISKEKIFKVLIQIQDRMNRALKGHKHILPE